MPGRGWFAFGVRHAEAAAQEKQQRASVSDLLGSFAAEQLEEQVDESSKDEQHVTGEVDWAEMNKASWRKAVM